MEVQTLILLCIRYFYFTTTYYFFFVKRDEWMNLDFASLKTVPLASCKSEREKEKILKRQKAQEIEQVGGINIPIFSTFLLHFV